MNMPKEVEIYAIVIELSFDVTIVVVIKDFVRCLVNVIIIYVL